MRALLSVWDKTGLIELATGLAAHGVELVASGGTAAALSEAHIAHLEVADVTGFPEMLDGRVKTLHPRLHAGILADRSKPEHLAALKEHDITPIDLVVSNLYPFDSNPSIELIDIGGPSMVRAAAKNHEHVGVLTNPSQYDAVLEEIVATGTLSDATRHALARAAFAHTAGYDAQIVAWLDRVGAVGDALSDVDVVVPPTLHLTLERAQIVRYGENPHQTGARYRVAGTTPWWDGVTQHAGSALSYLNLFDADAAWRLVHELADDAPGQCAVAIIKHANASGAAVDATFADAFQKALDADAQSAFGGIIAVGGELDAALASLIAAGPQADVIIASSIHADAVDVLVKRRKATRLLSAPSPEPLGRSVRTFGNSALVQNADELESLTSAGVTSVVQPGGSVRDQEVIDAANAAEIVMMLTGERHFRH